MHADPYTPSPLVREMEIDGEVTLFHTETQAALVLNETASDVWRLIDGERTSDEIMRLLLPVYDADPETLRDGVATALAEFDRHGLIETTG